MAVRRNRGTEKLIGSSLSVPGAFGTDPMLLAAVTDVGCGVLFDVFADAEAASCGAVRSRSVTLPACRDIAWQRPRIAVELSAVTTAIAMF